MSAERDTHFAEFARAIWQELMLPNGFIDVSEGWLDEDEIAGYQQIIAQRAYDLVEHTLKEVNPHHLDGFSPLEWAVKSVPDIESFPEQPD